MMMSINEMPVLPLSAAAAARRIGARAKALRLSYALTRDTLSARSGVPMSTIRKFEATGKIGLEAMLNIASALRCMDPALAMFPERPTVTLDEFMAPRRQRGSK